MGRLSPGDLVYIPCPEAAFLPGCVADIGPDGTVGVELGCGAGAAEGELRRVARGEVCLRFNRTDAATSQDNTSLMHMNAATILDNLKLRHGQNEIYTYTASVLLAVNPYKEISGLYGKDQCAHYRGKHIGALPPHPYAIADTSYRALVRERKNQALLISGESGAGKTETAKIVMEFLSYASGAATDFTSRIQARVLQAQPILESFGNAVTMRNSNSSRFGKYNRLFFDEAGALMDADITTYLLESSRVVVHGDRERTYHCFYEMLTGLSQERLQELNLQRGRTYRLMSCGGGRLDGFEERDAKNFKRLCEALGTVGLDGDAIDGIIEVLAGLVHLGDIPVDDSSPCQATNEEDDTQTVNVNGDSVENAARLLGMDADILCATLKRKKVAVPGRNSFHEVPRTESQFRQALHSLIKALYKRLFSHTVEHINGSFRELRPTDGKGGEGAWNHIGILDIYGFERLQKNSFEQLCINLANERLQQYFVENVLVAEQSLYKREGLPWTGVNLPDSQPVVNCITQVFKTLDEYSQLANTRGSASDEQFCLKTTDEAAKDPQRKEVLKHLKPLGGRRASAAPGMIPPALNQGFTIKHYAGAVEYSTKGWLDKNNDRLLPECERLICESTCPLVSALAESDQGKALFRSISKRYVQDLEGLLKTLATCNVHYIRCFKPNEEQRPSVFQPRLVLDQIIQCGTIELVKVMHDGYPNRCSFEEISTRFRSLLPERFQHYGMRTFIEALMLAYDVPQEQWALGMSRIFLKAGQLKALEDMRTEGAKPEAEKLASIVTGIIRKRWSRVGNAVRLCNYLPKFLQQIYEQRARRAAARRRLRGAIRAVQFARFAAASISELRKARLAKMLRVATLVYVRTRPWLAGSRKRLAVALAKQREEEERQREEARRQREEEERQREEERRQHEEEERQRLEAERQEQERLRLEDERKRLEEERKRLEEERLKREEEERQRQLREEEERLRLEAERRRLEEERLQREEADRQRLLREEEERRHLEEERKRLKEERTQREEEERRREEDQRRVLEREHEETQRIRDEQKQLQEERKVFEQERKVFEQKKRMCILAQASPQKASKTAGSSLAEELAQVEDGIVDGEVTKSAEEEDEVYPGDSASAQISSTQVSNMVATQINERLRLLEQEMVRKQEEVMQQMKALQEKNENLERTLAEERALRDYGVDDLVPSPGFSSKNTPQHARPDLTPCSVAGSPAAAAAGLQSCSGLLPGSLDISKAVASAASGSRPAGAGNREKRRSAFQDSRDRIAQQLPPDMSRGSGDIERRWLVEQRDQLLEELYPIGSPGGPFSRTPARDTWLCTTTSASTEGLERDRKAPTPGRPVAAARQEVCNLSTMFENAEDLHLGDARPVETPTPARQGLTQAQRQSMREAKKSDVGQSSATRPATSQFYWNKRSSTGGFGCA